MTEGGLIRRIADVLSWTKNIFSRLWRRAPFIRYDDCAHCWGSYPADQMVRCDLSLWHPIEIRDDRGKPLGWLRAELAQHTPLCLECKESSPVLFKIMIYPWGVEYVWWNMATGTTYRRKHSPEKPWFNIVSHQSDEEA